MPWSVFRANSGRAEPRSSWRRAFSFATISATSRTGRRSSPTRRSTPGSPKTWSPTSPTGFLPKCNEPRLLFELDRIILAFQLRQGGVQSVITVVARPRVPGGNTIELTLEKIRAGILPVPADNILDRIIEYARCHGVDAEWARKDGYPVVVMRYTPHIEREDVQLEELQIRDHQIRLAGRSDRAKGAFSSADASFAESASVEVPRAKDPRFARAGIGPRRCADRPRRPVEPRSPRRARDRSDQIEHPKSPRIHPSHRPPVARDLPFVIQVDLAMVAQAPRRQIPARNDRRIDRPGAQHVARLEHEVPVNSIPVVLEQDKPRHELITRNRDAEHPRISRNASEATAMSNALALPESPSAVIATSLAVPPGRPLARPSGFISHSERLELPGIRRRERKAQALSDFPLTRNRDESMDKTKLIEKLNEILKWEYAGLVQYTQFSFLVQDTWREVYYKFFRENGEEALKHAHLVGDKITALGGVPTVERGAVKQSTDLQRDARIFARSREPPGQALHRGTRPLRRKRGRSARRSGRHLHRRARRGRPPRKAAQETRTGDHRPRARPAGRRSVDANPIDRSPGAIARRRFHRVGMSRSLDRRRCYPRSPPAAGRRVTLGAGPGNGTVAGASSTAAAKRIRLQSQNSLKLLKLPGIELEPPLVEPADSFGVMLLSQVDQQPPVISLRQG